MTARRTKRLSGGERGGVCWIATAALLVVACRTGGPHVNRRTDGGARGDAAPAAPDTAAVLTGGPAVTGGTDAATGDGSTDSAVADLGPALPDSGPPPPPTDNGCVPPVESSGCDPVCNTGCEALSRCDVTDQPRTGRCIGIWISGEGDLCLKTDITDPCAPHLACVEGSCRRLCYRDADCAAPGTCCGQDLLLDGQPSGYKLCVACPR